MNSLNHYSYGSIAAWMIEYLGGIRPLRAGYRKAVIEPHPDKRLGSFSVSTDTASGTYKCSWAIDDEGCLVNITVPIGCEAEFRLGGDVTGKGTIEKNLVEGEYEFKL